MPTEMFDQMSDNLLQRYTVQRIVGLLFVHDAVR